MHRKLQDPMLNPATRGTPPGALRLFLRCVIALLDPTPLVNPLQVLVFVGPRLSGDPGDPFREIAEAPHELRDRRSND